MAFSGRTPYYYLALILMIVALAFFYRLQKSRFGHDLKVIGNSEVLASALGINVPKYRLICFVIACFFLGIGGSFYAHYVTAIEPQFFGIALSSNIFAFSVIGGIGNLWGGLLGTVVMTVIPEWMHAFENMRPLTYGIMIMFVMVFMPGGFISLPKQVRLWRRGKIRE
jgi:branched-chain amino acid transport system permease protein